MVNANSGSEKVKNAFLLSRRQTPVRKVSAMRVTLFLFDHNGLCVFPIMIILVDRERQRESHEWGRGDDELHWHFDFIGSRENAQIGNGCFYLDIKMSVMFIYTI